MTTAQDEREAIFRELVAAVARLREEARGHQYSYWPRRSPGLRAQVFPTGSTRREYRPLWKSLKDFAASLIRVP